MEDEYYFYTKKLNYKTIPKAYLKDSMTSLVFPSLIILFSASIPKNGISNSTITNVVETRSILFVLQLG